MWLALYCVCLLTYLCSTTSNAHSAPPHIVFILADDLGWADVGFHGSRQVVTPNVDALAADGVVLHRYYTHPMCTPSRAALMTGLYSSHTGMQHHIIRIAEPWGLPLHLTLLPQHLKHLGYATHLVGKWHLGSCCKEYTPTFRGFDTHFGFWGGLLDYYDHGQYFKEMKKWGLDLRRGMEVVRGTQGIYLTELLTSEAVRIIRNHNWSQPLFLEFSPSAPHAGSWYAPLRAPVEYIDRFTHIKDIRRRCFAAKMAYLDEAVGRVFQALHEANILNNTLLVFASDNGGSEPMSWNGSACNWPLRGAKGTLWEGGIRVPALVWSPLIQKTGNVLNEPIHVTDWLPTLYRFAGGNVEDLGQLDGLDVSDALVYGHRLQRSEINHRIDPIDGSGAVMVGDYKMIYGKQSSGTLDGWYGPFGQDDQAPDREQERNDAVVPHILKTLGRNGMVTDAWKQSHVVHCGTHKEEICVPQHGPCIFNIREDPCERRNLAAARPDLVRSLVQKVQELEDTMVYPGNRPIDDMASPEYHDYVWSNWLDTQGSENDVCHQHNRFTNKC